MAWRATVIASRLPYNVTCIRLSTQNTMWFSILCRVGLTAAGAEVHGKRMVTIQTMKLGRVLRSGMNSFGHDPAQSGSTYWKWILA